MKNHFLQLIPGFILFSGVALANDFAPCGNAQYVYVGDTVEQLLANCGNPQSVCNIIDNDDNIVKKTNWIYTQNLYINNAKGFAFGVNQGARYTVEFINDKVNVIYVEGEPVTQYDYCGNVPGVRRIIRQGDTMNKVRSLCGNPMLVNQSQEKSQAPRLQITEYTYQFDPSVAPVKVYLMEGRVTQVK